MEKTHINILQTVANDTPLFWVMLGLAALIAVGEVALIALAVRGRTSGRLAIAAAVAPVLLAAAMVASIQIGRASLLRGLATDDPAEELRLIVAGLQAFGNAPPLGLLLLGPVIGLAAIAAGLHAGAALKLPTRPFMIATLIVAGAGFAPLLLGALRYATQMTHVLSGVAGVDPEMKAMMVTKGIEETVEAFDRAVLFGAVCQVGALIFAIVTVAGSHFRALPTRIHWRSPVICAIAAAVLYLAAAPLRAEVNAPWPPSVCAALTINHLPTPDVDGPDAIPHAEVVSVSNTALLGDGAPRDLGAWHDAIVTMRNNYRLLHPADLVDESLVVVCPPDTKTERLVGVLRVAQQTQYRRPAFAFGKEMIIRRPLMGDLRRWQWTAAKALIPGVGPETPAPIQTLTLADYPTCDAVARAAAALRRAGKYPGLAF